jgi:uncharacterized phage protein (TIGR02220 family)
MFSKKITDTDMFLDMPLSTQALYFHLNLHADDDGFVDSCKKLMRMVGASDDDLRVLLVKRFILPFDNGVVVIKDWRIHNFIRKDTYNKTLYTEQKAQLTTNQNGSYQLKTDAVNDTLTERIRTVDDPSPQDRLGKDRLGKDSKNNSAVETPAHPQWKTVVDYLNEKTGREGKSKFRYTSNSKKLIEARLHEGFTVEDCKTVIDKKATEWTGTKWEQYLVVKTLFAPSHFESYLQAGESPNDKGGESYGGLVF